MKVKAAVLGYPSLINLMVSVDTKQHWVVVFVGFFVFVLFVCLFLLLLFWSLFCFVASDFLTTVCHLTVVNVCVIIILSIGNSQIRILLLCFLYLFAELMITMNKLKKNNNKKPSNTETWLGLCQDTVTRKNTKASLNCC